MPVLRVEIRAVGNEGINQEKVLECLIVSIRYSLTRQPRCTTLVSADLVLEKLLEIHLTTKIAVMKS